LLPCLVGPRRQARDRSPSSMAAGTCLTTTGLAGLLRQAVQATNLIAACEAFGWRWSSPGLPDPVGGKERAHAGVDVAVDVGRGNRLATAQQGLVDRYPQHRAGEQAGGERADAPMTSLRSCSTCGSSSPVRTRRARSHNGPYGSLVAFTVSVSARKE